MLQDPVITARGLVYLETMGKIWSGKGRGTGQERGGAGDAPGSGHQLGYMWTDHTRCW